MVALSLVLHGSAYAGLVRVRRPPVHERIAIEVLHREPVRARVPPPVPRPAPPRAVKAPTPSSPPPVAALSPAPPPSPAAPAAPSNAPRALPRVGLSLGSTVSSGGFAVGVGNTLYGRPSEKAEDPATVRPLVAAARLSRQPRPVELPRIEYPADARKAGDEGRVILILGLDAQGGVTSVRVLESPSASLAAAAQQGARRFRFSPALLDGEPVPTEIRFTYTFFLE
jgi:protein TonB